MPRYSVDLTRIQMREPTKEEAKEHDHLQAEAQAAFSEELRCLDEELCKDFPKLNDALRETILWRRLGWRD